jgi:hypothetical protein
MSTHGVTACFRLSTCHTRSVTKSKRIGSHNLFFVRLLDQILVDLCSQSLNGSVVSLSSTRSQSRSMTNRETDLFTLQSVREGQLKGSTPLTDELNSISNSKSLPNTRPYHRFVESSGPTPFSPQSEATCGLTTIELQTSKQRHLYDGSEEEEENSLIAVRLRRPWQ